MIFPIGFIQELSTDNPRGGGGGALGIAAYRMGLQPILTSGWDSSFAEAAMDLDQAT